MTRSSQKKKRAEETRTKIRTVTCSNNVVTVEFEFLADTTARNRDANLRCEALVRAISDRGLVVYRGYGTGLMRVIVHDYLVPTPSRKRRLPPGLGQTLRTGLLREKYVGKAHARKALRHVGA